MANLIKSANGLLFYDDFSEKTLMWTLTPSYASTALEFGDKGLRMKHSDKYTIYTIVEPEVEEYSCIVQLDHVPFNFEDIAGIIILSSNKEYAECQSYMATESSELNNSKDYLTDIENIVDTAIDNALNNYVQFTVNDEELGDTDETISDTTTPSDSIQFVDVLYKFIKFHKIKYKYMFYASSDGKNWIEIGNVKFSDSGVIGFFIYSTENQDIIDNSHCYFTDFTLYSSKYLNIHGINRKREIEMYDGDGNIIFRTDNLQYLHMISRSTNTCLVNTTTLPIPIKDAHLRVYSKDNYNVTIAEYELGDVYGGDEFTLMRDIKVFIDNQEISPNELYDLGTFYRGSYYIPIVVHNNEQDIASNIKLRVIKYSEYYGGEEEISLALYDDSLPQSALQYEKELIIDEIQPTSGRTVYMKLMDKPVQDFYMTASSYRFKIIIE